MAVAIVLLVLSNLLTLAVLAVVFRWRLEPTSEPEPVIAASVAGNRPRAVISVEILNPVDVAAKRSRLAGFAGAFVPRLTQRIVTDQVLRVLRQQLADEQVAADVRLHRITPVPDAPSPTEIDAPAVLVVDEVVPVRLDEPDRD